MNHYNIGIIDQHIFDNEFLIVFFDFFFHIHLPSKAASIIVVSQIFDSNSSICGHDSSLFRLHFGIYSASRPQLTALRHLKQENN